TDEAIFQRSGRLVHVVKGVKLADGIRRAADAPRIIAIPEAIIREKLTRFCRFIQVQSGGDGEPKVSPVHPARWCVEAVAQRGHWDGIRLLTGVVASP